MAGEIDAEPESSVVLLSIRPEYAELIMSGTKKTEFRKVAFARRITHAVVYASSPLKRVLGYFEVAGLDVGSPDRLWSAFRGIAGVPREAFDAYYRNCQFGCAIKVGRVFAFPKPLSLKDAGCPLTPPQSFAYLGSVAFRRVQFCCRA